MNPPIVHRIRRPIQVPPSRPCRAWPPRHRCHNARHVHRVPGPCRSERLERCVELGDGRRSGDPLGVCPGARSPRHRHAQGALRAVHRRSRGPGLGRRHVRHGGPGHGADPRAGREGHRSRHRQGRPLGPAGRQPVLGQPARAGSGPSTCSGSPGSCRSGRASSPSSNRWTRASRSRSRATSTSRSRRPHFWYYAGWADKLEYAFPGRTAHPLGVAAQIIPWNFPLLMLAWKIAPALAAGNTVVLKPASTTPLTALLFADVCRQADLPPGVVNIVPGPGAVGMSLVTHKGVDKVAFTGSTEIGRLIAKGVAGTDKGLTLELGGKAANIVFDDAPLDQAVEGIVNGIYFNQGEVCCAGSRLLVQESVAETLIDKLKDRLSTIRVGDPLDKNTDVGRDQLEGPAREDHRARPERRRRGRRALPARLRPARPRLLLPADAVHERRPEPPDRARGDLRAGPLRPDVPHAGRGDREGQQHGLRPVGRASGRTRAAGSCTWSRRCGPASCGPTRSTASTRRRRSVATRNRASGARAGMHGLYAYVRLEDR